MKLLDSTWIRCTAIALTAVCGIIAAGSLAYDHAEQSKMADAMAERLQVAEKSARDDSHNASAFEAEVSRQTAASLSRTRRQRAAGITLMVAGGLCVALMKWQRRSQISLPRCVQENVRRTCAISRHHHDDATDSVCREQPPQVDLVPIQSIVDNLGSDPSNLLPLLLAIDEHYHYLPPAALIRLSELTGISRAQIAEVVSFYSQFRTTPRGKHVVQVCCGTACHVAGADRILEETRRLLHIPEGGDTDADGNTTVEVVGCLGCCTLAPVLRMDDRIVGHAEVQGLSASIDQMFHPAVMADEPTYAVTAATPPPNRTSFEIRIGVGSCCVAGGSQEVLDTLRREIARRHITATLKPVGCVGICHLTPLIEVVAAGTEPIMATRVTPTDVRRIVRSLPDNSVWHQRFINHVRDVCGRGESADTSKASVCRLRRCGDNDVRRFLDPQVRIVTEHSGSLSPTSIDEYCMRDGFVALSHALHKLKPPDIIDAVRISGLRGRGGAGFPTHVKWQKVHDARGPKSVVCNGDEGDPGAFMDRMIMESYPYRVLEGLIIAAYATGADRALIYVRHEYPLAVKRLKNAIEKMTAAHWLGQKIAGSEFTLRIEIVEGGGAFVCGEETALLQSLMGNRGTPQTRPPYPVESGLFGRPTLVNNVETLANIPWIIRNGAARFAESGTETSKGTKVFSLAGKVRRGGLIEIPMGLTIREVVERIGGGVATGKEFKAVQIGGPSGGCIPAKLADTPIDYESLRKIGAIMGSGGLIVLDNDDCMVDLARYFLEFTQRESCGHCTFCRVGTRKLLDLLERLCAGKGRTSDLEEIEALSQSIVVGSLCGLGKTAPNPVLTTLKYFHEEYESHLNGRCPAGRCKALICYEVTRDCVGCTLCAQHCPVGAIEPTPYRQHWIDSQLCTRCDVCRSCCPEDAIRVV